MALPLLFALAMAAAPPLLFGPFQLDLATGELRKEGHNVRLQQQPLKVLALLAQRPGELVTREELQQKLWGDEVFVDFEHGLNFCIRQVRAALDDLADQPRYVETLPRRGYRFIASVTRAPPTGPVPPATDARPRSWRVWSALAVALLGLAGLVVARERGRAAAAQVMLAVLPFENLSLEADTYFADGLTEEMIAQLGRSSPDRLGVIARTSAMTYRGTKKTVDQVGRELGVSYIMEGSVRRDGDRVRITAQLIRVSDQTHLWAESYDRRLADVVALQEEVAGHIARALRLRLVPDVPDGTVPPAPAAYEAYLRGRHLAAKMAPEPLRMSIAQYDEAILLDPQFALPHLGLAETYERLVDIGAAPPAELFPKVRDEAQRAIALDPGLADAHRCLAVALFYFDWDLPGAAREFALALLQGSGLASTHHSYAWYLVSLGRMDEAVSAAEKAVRLDPASFRARNELGWFYFEAGRHEEAIRALQETLAMEPGLPIAHWYLHLSYVLLKKEAEAVEAGRRWMASVGARPEDIAAIAAPDLRESVRRIHQFNLRRLLAAGGLGYVPEHQLVLAYGQLNEVEKAIEWVERGLKARARWLLPLLAADPRLDGVRRTARYRNVLREAGLPPLHAD